MHSLQIIYDTDKPFKKALKLTPPTYAQTGNKFPVSVDEKVVKKLVKAFNAFISGASGTQDSKYRLKRKKIKRLSICAHNRALWEITLKGNPKKVHPIVELVMRINDESGGASDQSTMESGGGSGGAKNEGVGFVSPLVTVVPESGGASDQSKKEGAMGGGSGGAKNEDSGGTSGGSKEEQGGASDQSKKEFGSVVNALMISKLEEDLEDPSAVSGGSSPKRVAVVDSGSIYGGVSHAQVVGKIIRHNNMVTPVDCPMVDDPNAPVSVFDMICALSNKSLIDSVDLVNISQGWYAKNGHPVLRKVLGNIEIPVICSAGNEGVDTDSFAHWPSNFSMEFDHVLSVSSVQGDRNFGDRSVTVKAKGHWNNAVTGTSYATAWMSRMVAFAFSVMDRNDLNLEDISQVIKMSYDVSIGLRDETLTRLRFMP